MFSASEILDLAIKIEENGERFYRRAMQKFPDQALQEMLFWFAEQEARHREFFVKLKSALKEGRADPWVEQLSGAMLQGAVGDQLFSMEEVNLDVIKDVRALIATALDLERDTVVFYEIIASFVTDPAALRQLKAIINEEHKHIELFTERQKDFED